MTKEYDVVFKLPCEKTFTFNILVGGGDDYDPTTEVGNHPSQHMLDYFLYIIFISEFIVSQGNLKITS